MSQSASPDKCEPNMTPLLDVILQLVMFFMLCANFVMDQVNESIKLPDAIEAKALDKDVTEYIILNVAADGRVLTNNDDDDQGLVNQIQVENFLKTRYKLDQLAAVPQDWEAGKGRSVIIVRAHKDCSFKMVHDVMAACSKIGYTNIQLRAIKVDPNAA